MFKDYDKYLSTTLKVYLFVLLIIFILKIVGLDYFGLDINNPIILKVDSIMSDYHLINIYYILTLFFYSYMMTSVTCEDNSKSMFIYILIMMPIIYLVKYLDGVFANNVIMYFVDFLFLFFLSFVFNLKSKKLKMKILIKNFIKMIIINTLFQLISVFLRLNHFNSLEYGFVINCLLDLDYILLFLIYHRIYFLKGGLGCYQTEVGLSSLKKINLKKSLQKLRKNLQDSKKSFKTKSKEEKLTLIIFTILSLIWNILTVLIVLFIAKLNDTLIECIFILSSFWLSKRSFGKAFHFDSMLLCFIVSNSTYYVLNRITTPLGISILIPILLGVGLSYVTSKFVKKTYKPLYRGMPKNTFEETILQVVDKDSDKYNICYEFYIDKKSDLSLSYKYSYSVPGIRKIRDRVNEKIKRL